MRGLENTLEQITYRPLGRLIGSKGGNIYRCFKNSDFLYVCRKTNFILRFLRIHPVQNVINNPTQLSGRGFPHIFYMESVLLQLYVFLVLQLEVGPCNLRGQYIKRGLASR